MTQSLTWCCSGKDEAGTNGSFKALMTSAGSRTRPKCGADDARRVPRRAGGELVALEQHDVTRAALSQMIGDAQANGTTADDDDTRHQK